MGMPQLKTHHCVCLIWGEGNVLSVNVLVNATAFQKNTGYILFVYTEGSLQLNDNNNTFSLINRNGKSTVL